MTNSQIFKAAHKLKSVHVAGDYYRVTFGAKQLKNRYCESKSPKKCKTIFARLGARNMAKEALTVFTSMLNNSTALLAMV